MLAAAIGIDRAVEADVGRPVPGDDRLRLLDGDNGPQRRRSVVYLLADVEPVFVGLPHRQVESSRRPVFGRAAAVADFGTGHGNGIAQEVERIKN